MCKLTWTCIPPRSVRRFRIVTGSKPLPKTQVLSLPSSSQDQFVENNWRVPFNWTWRPNSKWSKMFTARCSHDKEFRCSHLQVKHTPEPPDVFTPELAVPNLTRRCWRCERQAPTEDGLLAKVGCGARGRHTRRRWQRFLRRRMKSNHKYDCRYKHKYKYKYRYRGCHMCWIWPHFLCRRKKCIFGVWNLAEFSRFRWVKNSTIQCFHLILSQILIGSICFIRLNYYILIVILMYSSSFVVKLTEWLLFLNLASQIESNQIKSAANLLNAAPGIGLVHYQDLLRLTTHGSLERIGDF